MVSTSTLNNFRSLCFSLKYKYYWIYLSFSVKYFYQNWRGSWNIMTQKYINIMIKLEAQVKNEFLIQEFLFEVWIDL